jgi:hypothetical protein
MILAKIETRQKTTEVKKSNKKKDSTENKERKTSVTGPDSYILGLPDSGPLVRGTDPDPNPSIIQKN